MTFSRQILSKSELLAASRVTATALNNMTERHQAGISTAIDGARGKQRLFSTEDAVRARLRSDLSSLGFPANAGLDIIDYCAGLVSTIFEKQQNISDDVVIIEPYNDSYVFKHLKNIGELKADTAIVLLISKKIRGILRAVQTINQSTHVNWESHEVDDEGHIVRIGLTHSETREMQNMRLRLHQHQLRTSDDHFEFYERYHGLLEKHRVKMLTARNKQPEVSLNWPS